MTRRIEPRGWTRPCSRRRRGAFSLLELLTVCTVIAVLAALILPAAQAGLARGRKVVCLNNLRQLGLALVMYREDHADFYPPANVPPLNINYQQCLAPYLRTATLNIGGYQRLTNVFLCPEIWKRRKAAQPDLWGYGYNESISRDAFFWVAPVHPYIGIHSSYHVAPAGMLAPEPSRKIAMVCNVNGNKWSYDLSGWDLWTQADPWELEPPAGVHQGRDHYLYCDGRVDSLGLDEKAAVNSGWFANTRTSPYE